MEAALQSLLLSSAYAGDAYAFKMQMEEALNDDNDDDDDNYCCWRLYKRGINRKEVCLTLLEESGTVKEYCPNPRVLLCQQIIRLLIRHGLLY